MKQIVTADGAPTAIGPYSHAVRVGNLLFTSGQIPIDPATGELVPGGIEAQAERVLENLGVVLRASGADYGSVVKSTIFLVDLGHFQVVNGVYAKYFKGDYPARSTIQVAALPKGSLVEIEAIAHVA